MQLSKLITVRLETFLPSGTNFKFLGSIFSFLKTMLSCLKLFCNFGILLSLIAFGQFLWLKSVFLALFGYLLL